MIRSIGVNTIDSVNTGATSMPRPWMPARCHTQVSPSASMVRTRGVNSASNFGSLSTSHTWERSAATTAAEWFVDEKRAMRVPEIVGGVVQPA